MRFHALVALSSLALVLFACSSEAPTGGIESRRSPTSAEDATEGTKASDSSSSKSSTSASNGSDTGSTSTGDASKCGSEAKMDACYQCCDAAVPGASDVLAQAFDECMCAADKCGTQCAQTACAGKEPQQGDACDQCGEQKWQDCDAVAVQKCQADPSCAKLLACEDSSKCESKPE